MKYFAELKKMPIFLFVALVVIDVSVLVLEKIGASAAGTAVGDEFGFTLRLAQTPSVWGVAVLSLLQLFVWNRILRQTDLSVAYPISSLFFPLAMLCSVIFFQEHVTCLAWTGGALITLGIGCFSLDKGEVSDHGEPALSPSQARQFFSPDQLNQPNQPSQPSQPSQPIESTLVGTAAGISSRANGYGQK